MSESDLRALPIWGGAIEIEPLSGGLTNFNYRVVDGQDVYAVRTGKDDPTLGIDRRNELTCTQAAARLGLAPRIVHSTTGLMVCDFIESTPLTPELASTRIERLARTVHDIHAAGRTMSGHMQYFSAFQVARTYVGTAGEHGLLLPDAQDADALLAEVADLEARIRPFTPTFCHNDMMPGNFLDTRERLWVIDWEYSGIGNPLFDLAGLCSNCEFDEEMERELLGAYGRGDDATGEQFRVLKAMAALRESLWAVLQGAQSTIDFDYAGYRDSNYRKYRAFRSAMA